jgi:hypothetical protein
MGLGKKLGQLNNTNSQQLQSAHLPMADGGYNQNNIPTLQSVPPMTQKEMSDVKQIPRESM